MERYKDLLAQKGQLEKLIAEAHKKEASATLERVREAVAEFGFTPEDVFGKRRKDAGVPVAPKYRHPETGETWSGRGRAPRWLKDQDLERFRITE
ncbi:H-NS histone family protein [Paraburkholderia fungorum]|jgi:DNA-binding protein H-NS|uniref:H-NS histone family protein n=1 Tax=Paraburkholderia fungorum TaxID=134537 RepID=A0AAP5V0W6_9BURK|nr:H-NS histone family protein [Paraburkholderia fungorum]MDT8843794.1 H-NS histone family protein [Paraburkholderia fungorum]